jgi:tellurite resistance protein TerC
MDWLMIAWLGKPLWLWLGFLAIVLALLALDLGVLHRKAHVIGVAESLRLSAFYVGLGLGYGMVVWRLLGATPAKEYWTAFLVEKSLAMDNVFVIAMVFSVLAIPRLYQHRVLFWGILGVIVLRGLMIWVGAALIEQFSWVLLLFAVLLVGMGVKMWVVADRPFDVAGSPVLRWLRRHLRLTDASECDRFVVRRPHPLTGRPVLWATPVLLALLMVEFVDLLFAIDSIPAVFAITSDPFIVYTSNIFAILGLRALYFALAAMVHRFRYLKHALSLLLIFVGGKILAAHLLGLPGGKVPPAISLAVTTAILAGGVLFSLWRTRGTRMGAEASRIS